MTKLDLLKIIVRLLKYIVSGRRYETINPYFLSEVIDALKAVEKEMSGGTNDFYDAIQHFEAEHGPVS